MATSTGEATVATPPNGIISRWLDRIGDRANPILVRIVRQELRSRAFIGVFVVLLVAAMIASVVMGSVSDQSGEGEAARGLFLALTWGWSFALVLVQPSTAYRTVSNERNEDTWDLVELTGMRPRRVLGGLLSAAAIQGMLYTSALAPFMVMSYLLRGLDLGTIIAALIGVLMAGFASSCFAACCACLGNNKATRALLGSAMVIALAGAWLSVGAGFSEQMSRYGGVITITGWGSDEWLAFAFAINLWLAFCVTMLVLAGTLLTFRAANRSTGPRLLCYGLWLNGLAWAIAIGCVIPGVKLGGVVAAFGLIGVVWSLVLGLFSISEDYELSPRQARAISEPTRWTAWLPTVLGPGAARGRWAYLVMATLSVATAGLGWVMSRNDDSAYRCAILAWATWCYAAILLALSDWLYRGVLRNLFPTAPLRRGLTLLLAAILSLAPTLILLVVDTALIEHSALAALSPTNGLVLFANDVGASAGAYLMVSIAGLIAAGVLARQGCNLALRTHRILARDSDRNPRGG